MKLQEENICEGLMSMKHFHKTMLCKLKILKMDIA